MDRTTMVPLNRKMAVDGSAHVAVGCYMPRVSRRKARALSARSSISPSLLIRCGCCDERVEVCCPEDGTILEINGVNASVADWRRILMPLLGFIPLEGDALGQWLDVTVDPPVRTRR